MICAVRDSISSKARGLAEIVCVKMIKCSTWGVATPLRWTSCSSVRRCWRRADSRWRCACARSGQFAGGCWSSNTLWLVVACRQQEVAIKHRAMAATTDHEDRSSLVRPIVLSNIRYLHRAPRPAAGACGWVYTSVRRIGPNEGSLMLGRCPRAGTG